MKRHLAENYDVTETENGKKGLEKAIAIIPDLVISDWMMPEMDGITLCQQLKTDETDQSYSYHHANGPGQ